MNATDTTTARKLTAHADCEHPATKTARAACRRARNAGAPRWIGATRESVAKGDTVRVTVDDVTLEGTLVGWGAKRLIVSVDGGQRHNITIVDDMTVQARV